jgi:predicted transposase YdaD
LLALGLSVEQIAQALDLDLEQVRQAAARVKVESKTQKCHNG